MSAEYSYDLFDDGADCAHDGHLVYGKIIRKKEKGESMCVDGRKFFARSPVIPKPHPIIQSKLEEWKTKSLLALDDTALAGYEGYVDDAEIKQMKADVLFFAENITHVSHSKFMEALKECCELFHKMYPDGHFVKISTTSLDSYKSDRWVEDIAIEEGFLKIPERQIENQQSKKTRQQVKFKVEDGMYSGKQFVDDMQEFEDDIQTQKRVQVYICPFISGGQFFRDRFLDSINPKYFDSEEEVKSIKEITIFFICSVNPRVTHILWWNGDEPHISDVNMDIKKIDLYKAQFPVRFIYHSLMEKEKKAVPFYFDHKLADEVSWDWYSEISWMFAGYHLPLTYHDNNETTNSCKVYDDEERKYIDRPCTLYIEGCESSQGHNEGMYDSPCPDRPWWTLKPM